MNLTVDTLLAHVVSQDVRVGGGYLLAVEPVDATIVYLLGNGQRQAALRETQTGDDLGIFAALHEFVLTDHADVSHTGGYRLGDIVIAQVEHFQGEIG